MVRSEIMKLKKKKISVQKMTTLNNFLKSEFEEHF